MLEQETEQVREQRMLNYLLYEIDGISKNKDIDAARCEDGQGFEKFLFRLYASAGYTTRITSIIGDGGVDLFAENGSTKLIFQAKRYLLSGTNIVRPKNIREFIGVKFNHPGYRQVFITTHYFTPPAIKVAEAANIELVDREKLYHLIAQLNPTLLAKALYESALAKNKIGRCPSCNSVTTYKFKKVKFKGCVRFPDCKCKISD